MRGRGHSQNPPHRFAKTVTELDTGVSRHESTIVLTELSNVQAKSILSTNTSPDIPFERSLNAYRGCEHGCVYCFARPTHAYLDLSPGLDFETQIFFKSNVADLLRQEFSNSRYEVKTISLGNITDVYQPVEKRLGITRQILEIMLEYQHPVSLVTKSSLIERDIDLYTQLARQNLVHVAITITTLNNKLARNLEPRAATPSRRLKSIQTLSQARVPVSVLVAPIIPVLTDYELENILEQSKEYGAQGANFVMLRLPHEVQGLFTDWLQRHYPLKAGHVLSRLKEMHGGELYRSKFGKRMRGSGMYASIIEQRFRLACKKFGINRHFHELDHSRFTRPENLRSPQLEMF